MSDFNAMAIPDGKTCGDCKWYSFCFKLFRCKAGNTECDWAPHRFVSNEEVAEQLN